MLCDPVLTSFDFLRVEPEDLKQLLPGEVLTITFSGERVVGVPVRLVDEGVYEVIVAMNQPSYGTSITGADQLLRISSETSFTNRVVWRSDAGSGAAVLNAGGHRFAYANGASRSIVFFNYPSMFVLNEHICHGPAADSRGTVVTIGSFANFTSEPSGLGEFGFVLTFHSGVDMSGTVTVRRIA